VILSGALGLGIYGYLVDSRLTSRNDAEILGLIAFVVPFSFFIILYRNWQFGPDNNGSTSDDDREQANRNREVIPREVKIFVWNRDGGKCIKCGSQERLEFGHILPVSKGGGNTARNIQLLCEICNRSKELL
jgi:hypothetical protein